MVSIDNDNVDGKDIRSNGLLFIKFFVRPFDWKRKSPMSRSESSLILVIHKINP